jgi:hypothetical protein
MTIMRSMLISCGVHGPLASDAVPRPGRYYRRSTLAMANMICPICRLLAAMGGEIAIRVKRAGPTACLEQEQ